MRYKTSLTTAGFAVLASALLLAGCAGTRLPEETNARAQVGQIGEALHPHNAPPTLPSLQPDSPPSDYLRFALLKHPSVAAAFHTWHADVEAITPARSLPDPQFTFEADIADMLMTFMPGLMFDIMAPGKRAAMGREAAATSRVSYRNYVTVVLRTAAEVRKAWIELAYIEEAQRLRETSLGAIEQTLQITSAEYVTGRAMGSLAAQVRLQNQAAEQRSLQATLDDRRAAARARFKSALGLAPEEVDPPWPQYPLNATTLPDKNELWRRVQSANADLAAMRAMIEMAVANVEVAKKSRTPDFNFGGMVDLKADPLMVRPTASVTLPIWRDKIAATIAAAEARRDAATDRLGAEQLMLATEFAQMLFMVREADRMIAYIDRTALPNLDRTLATAGVAYESGMSSPSMISETRLMVLGMRLERTEALRQRETAVTDLFLMAADVAPADAPLLTTGSYH